MKDPIADIFWPKSRIIVPAMEHANGSAAQDASALAGTWGFWALMAGALSVLLVFAQIALPMMEPQPSVGTQLGEIAGEIKRAAWRSFLGLAQPEPEPVSPPVWAYLTIAAPMFGVIAIVLSAISGILRENRRYAVYAAGLGLAAIMFQFLWLLAVLIAGIALLIAILDNIGDIFSF